MAKKFVVHRMSGRPRMFTSLQHFQISAARWCSLYHRIPSFAMEINEVPLSQRGHPLLWFDNRLWHCKFKKRLQNEFIRKYWHCREQGCSATATTDHRMDQNEQQIDDPRIGSPHAEFCQGDQHLIHKHLALQRFKQRSAAANPCHSENWRRLADELEIIDRDLINQVGNKRQLQHIAHYHHRRNQPKIRRVAAFQSFPGDYSLTWDNRQFLLYIGIDHYWLDADDYVSFANPDVLLQDVHYDEELNSRTVVFAVFGLEEDFEMLAEAPDVSADATFSICPRPYKQYFTMHTKFGNRSIPRLRVKKTISSCK